MIAVANPVLPGCYPDPSICRVGEWYYLVCSTFEYLPGIPVMRSRDLARWQTIGHVIDRPGMLSFADIASSGGLFAPTIRHGLGLFWVVCTLVDRERPERGGNFVVTAHDPAGPWSDPVPLDADGIDPSLVFDEDGRVWMHGTRPARDPEWPEQTEIWVREYSPQTRRLVGDEAVIWRGAVRGAIWAEGPHLYRMGGRWYLIAAEGGTGFHHAVAAARADAVTGPYEGCRANPVLTHRHLGRRSDVIGAGHADLVQAPDGSWWAVLLAMRTADGVHHPLGRETFLCPVAWEDGWPVFAPGDGRVPRVVELPWADAAAPEGSAPEGSAPDAAAPEGAWQPDDHRAGRVQPDDVRWTAPRLLPDEAAAREGGAWVLPVRPGELPETDPLSFLGIRQQHRNVDVRCRLDVTGILEGESAALVVRQSERDHAVIRATRRAGAFEISVRHRREGHEKRLTSALASRTDTLELGLSVRGDAYTFAHAGRALATVDGRDLDSAAAGGFLGLWIGVHATSHGAAARGAVRIDEFVYEPTSAAAAAR